MEDDRKDSTQQVMFFSFKAGSVCS